MLNVQSAFDGLPLPAIMIEPDRTLRSFNRLMLDHFRTHGRDELLRGTVGRDLLDLARCASHAEQLRAFVEEVFATDVVVTTDWDAPDEGLVSFIARYLGRRILEGEIVTGAVIVCEDISEQVQSERRERQATFLREAVCEQLSDVVLITDFEGTILSCNAAARETFGYSADEMVGQPLSSLSAAADVQGAGFGRLLEERGASPTKLELKCRRGGTNLEMHADLTVVEWGSERYACVVGRDLTEFLREERLDALSLLAGGLAHDFNNILMGIRGSLSLASDKVGPAGEVAGLLHEAEEALGRATGLTGQLLTFAKGGAPVKEPVQLEELLRSEARFASAGSPTRVDFDIEDGLWTVYADGGQLRQMTMNLVLNAIQAMNGPGSIEIALENVQLTDEDTSELPPGCYVKIQFTDSGPGIPPENIERIFNPYFSTKMSSGLGLAGVHSIVSRHGGRVVADSPPHSGARFTIWLPVGAEETASSAVEMDLPNGSWSIPAASSLRVLVMDDDVRLRAMMKEMLGVLNHDVDVAADGEEALALHRAALDSDRPFDVALLDLTIRGGMNGLEAGLALLDVQPSLPILLMSGYSKENVASSDHMSRFAGYLAKPFGLGDLRTALERQQSLLDPKLVQ